VALKHGYIVVGSYDVKTTGLIHLSSTVHTQYRCPGIQKDSSVVVATITERGGKLIANYRASLAQVHWCDRCPEELRWKWQDDAACYATYPPVDMIDMGQGNTGRAQKLIEEYCDVCPVQMECAEFALARPDETIGIWGGMFIAMNTKLHNKGIKALRAKYATLKRSSDAA
jgi:hypothetical protein